MRAVLVISLLLFAGAILAQTPEPIASVQWSRDSTVVGGQAELVLSLEGITEEPGEWYWDTTIVVPVDTSLKGAALDSLWEYGAEPRWYSNNKNQWQCRMPIQFWNAGLFFYGGLHIMDAENTRVIHDQEDLQTAMYVYYPNSIRQSQEPRPLVDIIPARHAHAESWIRLLWPALLWTLICVFIPLLLGRRKYFIQKKDTILLSAHRWWQEIQKNKAEGLATISKDDYAELSRQLRYWMEEKLEIPAKEWTTAQLERYAQQSDQIDPEQIQFLHRVDDIVYGFGQIDPGQFNMDQHRVKQWTEDLARTLDVIARSREEVEPILPDQVYRQSLEKSSLSSGGARAIASLINFTGFTIPLLLISLISGILPYYHVLQDSYGSLWITLALLCILLLLYVLVESFWNFYHGQTPGGLTQRIRTAVYPDYKSSFSRYLLRSLWKMISAPLCVLKLKEQRPVLAQDRATHIYTERY